MGETCRTHGGDKWMQTFGGKRETEIPRERCEDSNSLKWILRKRMKCGLD